MKEFGDPRRAGRVELEIEGRDLDRLLLLPGQARKTVGEGVGDAEVHHSTIYNHFVADSVTRATRHR